MMIKFSTWKHDTVASSGEPIHNNNSNKSFPWNAVSTSHLIKTLHYYSAMHWEVCAICKFMNAQQTATLFLFTDLFWLCYLYIPPYRSFVRIPTTYVWYGRCRWWIPKHCYFFSYFFSFLRVIWAHSMPCSDCLHPLLYFLQDKKRFSPGENKESPLSNLPHSPENMVKLFPPKKQPSGCVSPSQGGSKGIHCAREREGQQVRQGHMRAKQEKQREAKFNVMFDSDSSAVIKLSWRITYNERFMLLTWLAVADEIRSSHA